MSATKIKLHVADCLCILHPSISQYKNYYHPLRKITLNSFFLLKNIDKRRYQLPELYTMATTCLQGYPLTFSVYASASLDLPEA